jgi:hypothetical protein
VVEFSEEIHRTAWTRTAPALKQRMIEDSMIGTESLQTAEKRAQVASMHLHDVLESVEQLVELDIPSNRPEIK